MKCSNKRGRMKFIVEEELYKKARMNCLKLQKKNEVLQQPGTYEIYFGRIII